MKCLLILPLLLAPPTGLFAQTDTTHHGYPVTPFFETHPSTGVFCEFRNTLSSDHFHNGVDIPKPDGSPVYPVFSGRIDAIGTVLQQGDNAYIRASYTVGGLAKSDAYVHMAPNPVLRIGDSVYAYQTVLGNILPGLGHVHFTHGGPSGSALMNALRATGGFTPYIDNYPPLIRWVRFYLHGTESEFPGNRISGLVDMRAYITETSAGTPGDVTTSTSNNGVYLAGYKILSADRSTEVYVPPSNGVRYRFDRMPLDSYVHNAFATGSDLSTPIYTLTNGDGADYINVNRVVNPNSLDSRTLPVGSYTVMVFAADTRGLADTEYVPIQVTRQDLMPPAPPTILSVTYSDSQTITIRWQPNTDADLLGYRLYYSFDGTNWVQRDGESRLTRSMTSISYPARNSVTLYFRLAAVDSAAPPNLSQFSDVYGMRANTSLTKSLIVDGFDRTEPSGSWHAPSHPFAATLGQSIFTDYHTCANEEVTAGTVSLSNYTAVLWVLGDESTLDRTFDAAEQTLMMAYLRAGGKLLVTGSDVAWDLDRPSGPAQADRDFLHNFLKARYVARDTQDVSANGLAMGPLSGLSFRFGVTSEGAPYNLPSTDAIAAEPGATLLLNYGAAGNSVYGGTGFKGTFPGGTQSGAVVYLAFPFETITTKPARDTLMRRVYQYIEVPTGVGADGGGKTPKEFTLFQNYPNPFNPSTLMKFQVDGSGLVILKVLDVLGREVATLVNEALPAGTYTRSFDAAALPSGIYFYRLTAGSFSAVRKMILVK